MFGPAPTALPLSNAMHVTIGKVAMRAVTEAHTCYGGCNCHAQRVAFGMVGQR